MFASFNRIITKKPLVTNMLTTGFLFGSGDLLAQSLFPPETQKNFDPMRTLRLVLYGGIIFAPIGLKWYKFLGTLKPFKERTMYNAVLRVACDQLLFAPFVGIPMFYSAMACLELNPNPLQEARKKLDKFWWTTLRDNWTVWPAFQYINFAFVPPQYKLLAVNLFSIGWNCYLSWLLNGSKSELTQEPEQIMI